MMRTSSTADNNNDGMITRVEEQQQRPRTNSSMIAEDGDDELLHELLPPMLSTNTSSLVEDDDIVVDRQRQQQQCDDNEVDLSGDDDGDDSDNDNDETDSSSRVSASTRSEEGGEGSFDLNPNSTIMQDDLPGIALLKEIFPEEDTESLRALHHQHILSNQEEILLRQPSDTQHHRDDDDGDGDDGNGSDNHMNSDLKNERSGNDVMHSHDKNARNRPIDKDGKTSKDPVDDNSPFGGVRQRLAFYDDQRQTTTILPDDFLRLPLSVAVLRPVINNDSDGTDMPQQYKYELLSDLQRKVMNEYSLCNHGTDGNNVEDDENRMMEFHCFAVKKDARWGLGMTLQEDEKGRQNYATPPTTRAFNSNKNVRPRRRDDGEVVSPIPFGLNVVGFLPDPDKIKKGEINSDILMSPAQAAGVHIDDVLIGVNGSAFLLPRFSSGLYASGHAYDEHYNIQKGKIIQSIQSSPDPIVLHIRRRKAEKSISLTAQPNSDTGLLLTPPPSSIQRNTSLLDSTSKDEFFDDSTIDNSGVETPSAKEGYSTVKAASTRTIVKTPSSSKMSPSHSTPLLTPPPSKQFNKHPLSHALVKRHLIRPGDDEWRITSRLKQFTERTRQWESSSALRLKVESGSSVLGSEASVTTLLPYFDPKDLPPEMAALIVYSGKDDQSMEGKHVATESLLNSLYTPSTPSLPHDSPLIPVEYLQAFYGEDQARQIVSLRSDLQKNTVSFYSNQSVSPSPIYPAFRFLSPSKWTESAEKTSTTQNNNLAWVPLHGIRKSLSARIVNSFLEETSSGESGAQTSTDPRMAYTIWVYDVESGHEWYAPIRYWKDFCDLRDAAMALLPTSSNAHREISGIKFPREPPIPASSSTWAPSLGSAVFGSRYSKRLSPMSPLQLKRRQRQDEEFEEARLQICCILEDFLRELLGIVYTCQPLQPSVAEIALYVQSFLGVDAGVLESPASNLPFDDSLTGNQSNSGKEKQAQKVLKRSIQRYTWRVFLLHSMKAIVRDFVDLARARGPKLQDVEVLESQGKSVLKSKAAEELEKIQIFLDSLVDLIIDGSKEDFEGIANRLEYASVHDILNDQVSWDRLVREAVREQVEIEVYIPLRNVVSRLLVNGWRHEDMESNFKIKELRKRPQHLFRIPDKNISPSDWQSVASILRHGVGMSTLPCVKLQAIVDAAREISLLHEREHGEDVILGADDFLPIFIFCVVRAEMERPCALCVLLKTLCDKSNRIGEIGYFLASFEAAITHIQEIDLSEDRESMLSFASTPLTDISLG